MEKKTSRTGNSVRNGKYALGFYALTMLLSFVSRRVFIQYLGDELLGLNSTALSLLEFLCLAEMGLGLATSALLYKPLNDGDHQRVAELVALQGMLYRCVSAFLIVVSGVLMFFFPRIFADSGVPLAYAYATYAVLLFAVLLSYLVTYRSVLLSADQMEYLVVTANKVPALVRSVMQIFAMIYLPDGYVWWLVLQALAPIVSAIMLRRAVSRHYPYLDVPVGTFAQLRAKHPEVLTKVGQVFIHRVATQILRQSSTLILFAYSSLSMVAVYGNYMLIVQGVNAVEDALFNGIQAGVGNLVAQGDRDHEIRVFHELFTLKFFVAGVFAFGVYALAGPFVSLWVGAQYVLSHSDFVPLCVILYIGLSRSAVDCFITAKGMFADVWVPIVEAVLNVSLSVWLGSHFGLSGILWGVTLSLVPSVLIWKPFYLFHYGLQSSLWSYWSGYVKHVGLAVGVLLIFDAIGGWQTWVDPSADVWQFLVYAVLMVGGYTLSLFGVYFLFCAGMRSVVGRVVARLQ